MKKIVCSEFNIDTASAKVKYADGSIISTYYSGSELDWLIYNDPAANADLISWQSRNMPGNRHRVYAAGQRKILRIILLNPEKERSIMLSV